METNPTLLVVEGHADRRQRMVRVAQEVGLQAEGVDSQKAALSAMRQRLPDVLWAGAGIKGGTLRDFFGVVQAAYPAVPRLLLVPAAAVVENAVLLEEGAFDLLRDEDPAELWRAGLRRALTEVNARAAVRDERGRFLGAQSRLSAMAPAIAEMLTGVSDSLRDAAGQPDISLRKVETVCAVTLSRFLDGAVVVVMAYERATGVLRPRGTSHATAEHQHAADHGFLLTDKLEAWKQDLAAVGQHAGLRELIRDTYGVRHALLCMIGPPQEPYGAAAFLTQNAEPVTPDEAEILQQVSDHVAQCIRITRTYRQVLRRTATGAG
jgi:CheY-like chemotaxis protein